MKNLKTTLYILSFFIFFSCEEEKHEPYFAGETPNPVMDYSVKNLPGAAEITFNLTDKRTAYVKAVYTVEQSRKREAKASKYDNKLIVHGFADSKEYSIALYAIGTGDQESEPVHITVHPETPPYKKVLQDLDISPDYGGGKILGTNITRAKLLIGVVMKDPNTKEWVDVDVFYTEGQTFDFNFRDQKPIETEFGFYTRDQWHNYSDTLRLTFEPWEEIKLPLTHNNFNQIVLSGDAVGRAGYGLSRLFDGARLSWADGFYSVDGTTFPATITIDLQDTYQLSRFRYWQNYNLYYQSANAKHIRIWGQTELNTDLSTWYLLGEWDNWRPSGLPPNGNEGLTVEDIEAAEKGNDFDFPRDSREVRYIRIEAVSTWEPRKSVYYPELEFWGRRIRD